MSAIIETKDLQKQYRMGDVIVEALKGVDFAVREGEFVAIMGPSGSGKSTLLHLLGGLDLASGGEVFLADRRLTRLTDTEVTVMRRRHVGFVFQFFNLLPTLTVTENVALPLLLDGQSMKENAARVAEILELVNMGNRAGHTPDQLSGGEQQRVAIARALVTDPKILLADEPTGNLDSVSGEHLLLILRRACDDDGQTIIIVTHNPAAAAFADRVVFLQDGALVHEILGGPFDVPAITEAIAHVNI
ncbi:MAG: ABC transporter ATP-binding protein [Anaerolineales bacterium]